MQFNECLRKFRTNKNLTQQNVADILGIDKTTYSGYETGKREPDVFKIKKLATIFGVSGDELLGLASEEHPSKTAQTLTLSEHEEKLVSAYRNKPRMQDAVDRLLGIDEDEYVPVFDSNNNLIVRGAARSDSGDPIRERVITPEQLEKIKNAPRIKSDKDLRTKKERD